MRTLLTLLFSFSTIFYLASQNGQDLILVEHEDDLSVQVDESQKSNTPGKWSVGFNLGLSQNGTDTHSWGRHASSIFNQSHLAYGLEAKYSINQRFGLRLDYIGSTISGDDRETDGPCSDVLDEDTDIACHRERAWQFSSPIHELSLNFEWDILGKRRNKDVKYFDEYGNQLELSNVNKLDGLYYDAAGNILDKHKAGEFRRILSPYISIGAALTYVDPTVIYPDNAEKPDEADILRDQNEQQNIYPHFPVTVGLRYDLSERMYIDGELRGVYQQTDLLDGIKHTTNHDDYRNNKDAYQFALIRLGYRLGVDNDRDNDGVVNSKDMCPDMPGIAALDGCPDSDLDGVIDALDICPDLKGPKKFGGCPDSDGDGIQDHLDRCPDVKGSMATNGCPDTDGDGIIDLNDNCPEDMGILKHDGCPDSDGDDVPDYRDACPFVPGEEAYHGCNEGYPSLDAENRTKYSIEGPNNTSNVEVNKSQDAQESRVIVRREIESQPSVEQRSETINEQSREYRQEDKQEIERVAPQRQTQETIQQQQTNSSIENSSSRTTIDNTMSSSERRAQSSSTTTSNANSASTQERQTVQNSRAGLFTSDVYSSYPVEVSEVFNEAISNIKFNSSKSSLKKSSYPTLNKVVRILSINPDLYVTINGHTDSSGDSVKNKKLSLARAESVKKFLMLRGIQPERLATVGHGADTPVADNATAEGRELNRRVEFFLNN